MNLWRSLAGMVEVELTSADPEGALASVTDRNIAVFCLGHKETLTVKFQIYRKDVPVLKTLCEKRGDRLVLKQRLGIYWTITRWKQRPILVTGMTLLLLLNSFLPTRILFVEVQGNNTVSDRMILEAVEELGVCFGASRKLIRSEKVKNALLGAIPQLQWAGVNTHGCVAVVSVRERAEEEKPIEKEQQIGSIIADRDGIVVSSTVLEGTGKCIPGQAVQRGQILISCYTDCGSFIRAVHAKGEVYARTRRDISVFTPSQWAGRREETATERRYSLILGKKRINLWKGSGIWDTSCGRIEKEYPLVLPGGFCLPVSLSVEELHFWNYEPVTTEDMISQGELTAFTRAYLSSHMIAGQILSCEESVSSQPEGYLLTGRYDCLEMIGRERVEEIGE